MAVDDNKKFDIVNKVREYALTRDCDVLLIDGVKAFFEDGAALIRASNTGPNLTLRFEAKTKERLEMIKEEFMNVIKQ